MKTAVSWRPRGRRLSASREWNSRLLRVLIADDKAAVARTHQRMVLQGLGFARITEAGDGAQAIAAATREPFDLIVTDYNMPLMDGYALVSYLKQTPATATIPIVMVTTETSPAILDPVRKLGVVAVLDKGFAPATVKEVIDQVVPGEWAFFRSFFRRSGRVFEARRQPPSGLEDWHPTYKTEEQQEHGWRSRTTIALVGRGST